MLIMSYPQTQHLQSVLYTHFIWCDIRMFYIYYAFFCYRSIFAMNWCDAISMLPIRACQLLTDMVRLNFAQSITCCSFAINWSFIGSIIEQTPCNSKFHKI